MLDASPETMRRRNVLKRGAIAVGTVVTGGIAVSGTATANPGKYDGFIAVQGTGTYTIELDVSNIDVEEEGVYYTKSIKNGTWVVEGHVDGHVNGSPNEYAWMYFEEFDSFESTQSQDDVDVIVSFY